MDQILTLENGAEILRTEVDNRIARLRPMATPVDQLSRHAATRQAGSMTVDYYAVATCQDQTTVSRAVSGSAIPVQQSDVMSLGVADAAIYEPGDTLMIPDCKTSAGESLILYVTGRDDNGLRVNAINTAGHTEAPASIQSGMKVVRLGKAAAELDVQTSRHEALPEKRQNYCQIFKAQIEQTTLMRMANKEVGWTFSDQEEVAIYDMRLGMERSFLFGHKARFIDPAKKSEVFLTQGIWNQAGKQAAYPGGKLAASDWLKVMSAAFTGHAGSARKILIAGTQLIEQLSLLEGNQRVMLPGNIVSRWGLDFNEMHSKFGTLYVIHSEIMDTCGHAADGLIIDPEYLTKYVHVPFNASALDLRSSGQRNTDALVLTEVSCLVLRYPEAHVRVVAQTFPSKA